MLEDKPDEAYMCDVHVVYVGASASRHEFTSLVTFNFLINY